MAARIGICGFCITVLYSEYSHESSGRYCGTDNTCYVWPIACINRKLDGSASAPTFCDTRAAIGTADTPAEPISGFTFP